MQQTCFILCQTCINLLKLGQTLNSQKILCEEIELENFHGQPLKDVGDRAGDRWLAGVWMLGVREMPKGLLCHIKPATTPRTVNPCHAGTRVYFQFLWKSKQKLTKQKHKSCKKTSMYYSHQSKFQTMTQDFQQPPPIPGGIPFCCHLCLEMALTCRNS